MPIAEHELSAAEISERFGLLLTAGVQGFREDVWLLVDVAEDWARDNRKPLPPTPEERERHAMMMHKQRALTLEVKARQDEILRQRFAENVSSGEVAMELRIHAPDVLKRWRAMGLSAVERPRVHVRSAKREGALQRETTVRMHAEQGLTQQASATILGISQGGVSQIRRRLGIA